ncbi:hypothetical protein Lser_V15G37536 [Lactuca serriola]
MATHKLFTLKSYFNFMDEPVTADLVQRTMKKICRFLWVLLCDFVLFLSGHLIKHLARSRIDNDHENNLDTTVVFNELEEPTARSSRGSNFIGFDEDYKSEFTFGFQFQMKEEDFMSYKGVTEAKSRNTGEAFMENELKTTTNTSKYQFVPVHNFSEFVAAPESASFTVHESVMEDDFIIKEKGISKKDFSDLEVEQEPKIKDEQKGWNETSNLPSNEKVDDFIEPEVSSTQIHQSADLPNPDSINSEEKSKESVKLHVKDQLNSGKNGVSDPEKVNWLGDFFMRNDSFSYGVQLSQEHESDSLDSHLESYDSSNEFISISPQDVEIINEKESESLSPEEIDDDYIEFEPNLKDHENIQQRNLDSNAKHESDAFTKKMESQTEVMKTWELDLEEEEDEADVLLEHQELIGQMKMELKNARTGGLPTILEESETPRMKEDLKPLKMDEKLEHRDLMAEIQKFYKSYNEKMRKLDVLNYQTLQAINFLRMKHPDQMNTGENNTSLSALKSVLLPSLWPCKLRRIYADPTLKSITELNKDLEIVYVGQACLSWEILHWQYKKSKELQLYDPQGYRSYNQVAIEFQQFYVLLRRFTEDELFQGPRVLNYTKQRCILKGLLQVPAIRDDNLKEKKARKEDKEDIVSISTIATMIKESMTVFWEFLHTDKDTTNLFLTIILQGTKAHLQDPNDSTLFMEIKANHQKKERRLKDMLRTGNCIVKKFQKHQETILDQHMFVSQVELRLVSRVLSLPRLSRDQLVWCQSKLNNIKFVDRKVEVEDSLFLLFPC